MMKNRLTKLLLCVIPLIPLASYADNQPFIRQYGSGTPLPGSGPGNPTPAPGQQTHAVTNQYGEQVIIIDQANQTPIPAATPVPVEITPVAQAILLATAIPTAFGVTPIPFTNTAALRAVRINNGFNIDIWCTYGAAASTPIPFTVPAGAEHFENFAANGAKLSSGVSCIHPVATPASGTLQIWGY